MGIFISAGKTIECVAIALVFSCLLSLISFRPLGILQECGYKNTKFLSWAGRKNNMTMSRLMLLSFAALLSTAALSLCFIFIGMWSAIVGLIAYLALIILYLYAEAKKPLKTPATLTPRFKRLFAAVWLVTAVFAYAVITLLNFADYLWGQPIFAAVKYCALALFPVALPLIICLANLITLIYEAPKNASYIKKAKAKLAAADVVTVGITGSYGKTSTKNILSAMLSKKYKVLSTPRSFNTPLGVARTLNGADLGEYDVFIAEMGARKEGDVAELCAICPPDYSVITGVCPQHLESFKSIENIVRAKGEIITATKKLCVIADDCYDSFEEIAGEKTSCGCLAEVVADSTGTAFTLNLGGESIRVKTKLLGEHSARNIALCARLAYETGVSADDIKSAIEELDFTEHRLQLIQSNGVNILDDGYNSNVVGAEAAITVLKYFGGKKVCVTPGLVELGVLEEEENEALGAKLVGLDLVVLVGETLVGAVKRGYDKAGGDGDKIKIVPTLEAAQDILSATLTVGDAVLFLNDLPDMYA